MSSRLGIDVGGTFTDLLLFDERSGAMRLLKTPSTPSDQSVGILNGIQQLIEETGVAASDITALLHGTTVSTNIVLEERAPKSGSWSPRISSRFCTRASQTPGPLAGWIIMQKPGSAGRSRADRGFASGSVRAATSSRRSTSVGPQGGARTRRAGRGGHHGSLMHSFAKPLHEQRIKAIVEETAPEMASLSSQICTGFRGISAPWSPS